MSVGGAGVGAENQIAAHVKAFIDGDGTDGIVANSISLNADDASSIKAVAGAASIMGSASGEGGVSVSIGLSLAYNKIENEVAAYVADVSLRRCGEDHIVGFSMSRWMANRLTHCLWMKGAALMWCYTMASRPWLRSRWRPILALARTPSR